MDRNDDYTPRSRLPLTPAGALDHVELEKRARRLRNEALAAMIDGMAHKGMRALAVLKRILPMSMQAR